jgi:hypothetical protein
LAELLSAVPSVVCVGKPHWTMSATGWPGSIPFARFPARRTFRAGHRRTNQPSPHSIIIVVGWLALGALD